MWRVDLVFFCYLIQNQPNWHVAIFYHEILLREHWTLIKLEWWLENYPYLNKSCGWNYGIPQLRIPTRSIFHQRPIQQSRHAVWMQKDIFLVSKKNIKLSLWQEYSVWKIMYYESFGNLPKNVPRDKSKNEKSRQCFSLCSLHFTWKRPHHAYIFCTFIIRLWFNSNS